MGDGTTAATTTSAAEKPIILPLSAEEKPLFSTSLISPDVSAALPEGYVARPLRCSDYHRGFLDVLRVLTTVGDISEEQWTDRYNFMAQRSDEYFLVVICDGSGLVVGTGSLIVERKFIHSLGVVGHIEDIAVAREQQGKKLGLRLIQSLDYIAEQVGCYKSILDCSEPNEGFYLKCGFRRAGLEMAHYYRKP
ncbi:Acyl-CoA N-acyltransferase [Elaphomyces granulatus]|jgi:glucosamine-phosphate N-acetyltransferase